MNIQPTAITGIGIVSPYGHNKTTWFEALCRGQAAIGPLDEDFPPAGGSRCAVRIHAFDPRVILRAKGLTHFGRTHLLTAAAAHLALTDASPLPDDFEMTELGVVQAMTFGTIHSITSFYGEALTQGPSAVSPLGFANTVANSPASRTAILLGAKGLNITLAHGETAGLEALALGARHLEFGPERMILAGSGYSLCPDMRRAYGVRGLLSPGRNGGPEHCRPLDQSANGVVLGEMAVCMALERPDVAEARGARILGLITGHAQGFAPGDDVLMSEQIIARTMAQAIERAGLTPGQISWVAAAANSHPRIDAVEAGALRRIWDSLPAARIAALKSMSGECLDVAGPQGVAAAVLSMANGLLPPTAGLIQPRSELPEGCLATAAEHMTVSHVLVNTIAFSGGCSALVVSAPEG